MSERSSLKQYLYGHEPAGAARRPVPRFAPDLDSALHRLVPRWLSEGVGPHPPATADDVRAVFRRLGSVATPDVVALYTAIGGMDGMCDNLWCLWPLERVAAQQPSEYGVLFADYLISSGEYRLVPSAGACSAVHLDRDEHPIGLTLEAFLTWQEAAPDFLDWFW